MKKIYFIILSTITIWFSFAETFPTFPMTIYWEIKIWETPLDWWIIKVYNSFDEELTTYEITETWKYWSDNVSKLPLLLNQFEWHLVIKVLYEWKTYIIDEIDDSNKKDQCPDISSITFVSDNCRYNITLKEEIEDNSTWNNDTWNNDTWNNDIWNQDAQNNDTWTSNNYSNSWWHSHRTKNINNNKELEKNAANELDSTITKSDSKPTNNYNLEDYQDSSNKEEIQENWLTNELNKAYQFSYNNWITTKENIKEANMKWNLTRVSAAKMLAQYAMNVLWKKPDISKWILRFNDASNELNERYNNAITLSYQLWIMWINTDWYFRPYDIITRAEFATALSRMLYWTENWTNLYYTTHLNKLKQEWIIKKINPDLKEIRWFAMLMLMRASAKNW